MELKTTIPAHKGLCQIDHASRIMLVGSCFSTEVGLKLNQAGFHTHVNPFGTLFNPHSIFESLNIAVRNKKFGSSDFFEHNGLWHSYKLHSKFSSFHLNDAISTINANIEAANKFIFNANVLIITFGSAWVYELKESERVVANCHKMPQSLFNKRKLGINEIITDYSHLLEHLKGANPNLKVIFTVSPVKHLKDGFIENTWSKSTLNVSIHELVRRFDFCDYYPSFEILNDDLRDYRFYKNDMVHPSDLATQYIFDHFKKSYCTPETIQMAGEFAQLTRSIEHRTVNRESTEYSKFITDLKSRAERLMNVNEGKVKELLSSLN
ncbi:MAG TPA: GSCFA domain-containing protein [Flavobacteriales bacterium]|nr:GSCFA domain-containing protein [Flavobacteriales bacterium]